MIEDNLLVFEPLEESKEAQKDKEPSKDKKKRLEALRKSIEDGSYSPSSQDVAEAVFESLFKDIEPPNTLK